MVNNVVYTGHCCPYFYISTGSGICLLDSINNALCNVKCKSSPTVLSMHKTSVVGLWWFVTAVAAYLSSRKVKIHTALHYIKVQTDAQFSSQASNRVIIIVIVFSSLK